MAYMGYATMQDYINSIYEPQITAANSAYDASAGTINQNITNANQTYQPLRDQAYVNQLMQQRIVNENMANAGLSNMGGTSLSLQQNNRNAGLANQNAINLQQQSYIQGLESELRNAQATRDAALASVQMNKGSAMIDASNTEYNRAYQLYANGDIGADQFTAMTGVQLTPKKRTKAAIPTPKDIYDAIILAGGTPADAYIESGYTIGGKPDYIR